MTAPRYRAWRFVHPELEAPEEHAGIRLSPTGGIALVEDHAAIRQAILLLLSTAPGERVMRPDYGCELRSLVFSPNDDTTAGLAIHYVRRAIQRWEPRVEIVRLDSARGDAEPGRLEILLEYRVRATRQVDRIRFQLNISGEPI